MSLGYPDAPDEFDEDEGEFDEEAKARLEALRAAFVGAFVQSSHGEAVLSNLYQFCHYGSPTFVPGQPDLSAFNEGKRRVMLHIMGLLQMDDEELFRQTRRVTRGH